MERKKIKKLTAGAVVLGMVLTGSLDPISFIPAAAMVSESEVKTVDDYLPKGLEKAVQLTFGDSQISGLGGNGTFDGRTLTIMKAGCYRLTGEFEGNILVSTSKKSEVVLVLDGFRAVNENGNAKRR